MNTLMKELIQSYDENDSKWGTKALVKVDDYWAKLGPSKSKADPDRLGSKSVFLSKLKSALIETLEPYEVDGQDEFNNLSTKDQQKFKIKSLRTNTNDWVHDCPIVPRNIEFLSMTATDSNHLKKLRSAIDNRKLKEPPLVINGDELIQKLLPLLNGSKIVQELVPALLLATGRRTIEILKTADFNITEDMATDGFTCVFSGQAKQGLENIGEYEIPLLAPFWLVKKALDKVRTGYNASKESTEQVHAKFANQLNKYCKKLGGVGPHELRAIYAVMCYQLNKRKASMMGYIAGILGHSNPQNATYYQRVLIENFSGVYKQEEEAEPEETKQEENDNDNDEDWKYTNKPEWKRIQGIKEMMLRKKRITASSVRANAGGTMALLQRVIHNNQAKIDAYNATL
jgi:integrase